MLTGRLQDILDRGGDIIRIMDIQSTCHTNTLMVQVCSRLTHEGEQQQEAIASLQRRVDQIATLQLEEMDRHHPDSSSVRRTSGLPPAQTDSDILSGAGISGLGLNVVSPTQASVSKAADESGGQVPEPMTINLQRKISTGHREFEEKALAVSALSDCRGATDCTGFETSQWGHRQHCTRRGFYPVLSLDDSLNLIVGHHLLGSLS